ncbi:MAG: sigma-70 family RNA polymerase sigma factor [Bacteroidota bacterium]
MSAAIFDYREKVFQYFLYKTGNKDESHDLAQEVFMKVVSQGDHLKTINDIDAWIFKVSKNLLIDFYRKNNRSTEKPHFDNELETATANVDQEELIESMLVCQRAFFVKLDPETRMLIQKVDIEGMSQKEVAEHAGLVYATVRSKVQRGRRQLRKMFLKACEMEYDAAGNIASCSHKSSCASVC